MLAPKPVYVDGHLSDAPQPLASPALTVTGQPLNALALVSFISSILGFGLFGVIFGHLSLAQLHTRAEEGRIFALMGVILGWVEVGFAVLAVLLAVLVPLALLLVGLLAGALAHAL